VAFDGRSSEAAANFWHRSCEKNLAKKVLSWLKVLPSTSMKQKLPYTLRISEKAKHVRFQVSEVEGVEVVFPKIINPVQNPAAVEQNNR